MLQKEIIDALCYLKDYANDNEVSLYEVDEAIEMFENSSSLEECKKWVEENIL